MLSPSNSSKPTFPNLALVFPCQKVFEEITKELQSAVLERVARTMEQLEKIEIIVEVGEWCDFF